MSSSPRQTVRGRPRPSPVITPGLRGLLFVVFGLFALLVINAVYLASVTFVASLTLGTLTAFSQGSARLAEDAPALAIDYVADPAHARFMPRQSHPMAPA